ncbi:hypothetical protein LINGRAHAP2_LOCUS9767 [Linum grandiflorum]
MVEELKHQVAVFQLRLATAEDKSHRRKGKIVALKAELNAVRETHKALTIDGRFLGRLLKYSLVRN